MTCNNRQHLLIPFKLDLSHGSLIFKTLPAQTISLSQLFNQNKRLATLTISPQVILNYKILQGKTFTDYHK